MAEGQSAENRGSQTEIVRRPTDILKFKAGHIVILSNEEGIILIKIKTHH
jgi:hypothetical protein